MNTLGKKTRIAWFSPLPIDLSLGKSNLSSYLTSMIIDELLEYYDVEFFHEGDDKYYDYKTFNYLEAINRHKDKPFDIFFYNIEDSYKNNFCRFHLELVPGVTLFYSLKLETPLKVDFFSTDRGRIHTKIINTSDTLLQLELDKDSIIAVKELSYSFIKLFLSSSDFNFYLKLKQNLENTSDYNENFHAYNLALLKDDNKIHNIERKKLVLKIKEIIDLESDYIKKMMSKWDTYVIHKTSTHPSLDEEKKDNPFNVLPKYKS